LRRFLIYGAMTLVPLVFIYYLHTITLDRLP
jgi:hypothetical protein